MAAVSVEQTERVCHLTLWFCRRYFFRRIPVDLHHSADLFSLWSQPTWRTRRQDQRQRDKTLTAETFLMSNVSNSSLVRRKDPRWVADSLRPSTSFFFKLPLTNFTETRKLVDFSPPEFITSISLCRRPEGKINTNFLLSYFGVQCREASCIFLVVSYYF